MTTKQRKPKRKEHRPHAGYEYTWPGRPPHHPGLLLLAEAAQRAYRPWSVCDAYLPTGGPHVETLLVGDRGQYEVAQERPDGTYWTGTYDAERAVTRLDEQFAKRLKAYRGENLYFDLTGAIFQESDLDEEAAAEAEAERKT
ncbi:hypothetical protein [Corallococcus sp. AS-1-6]|uniref:hypothetical protein n=1 Tax=Corallococcus sp. AS-1-6 TaxID=2874599 RepID=UPI001CBC4D51|nr:hypothetical protein [Corallococcus sp. AS-1-6]MBZ4373225.1 hypothetical protein [Corallococcus sp. AS-1-6]